jgi:hypothetical protein
MTVAGITIVEYVEITSFGEIIYCVSVYTIIVTSEVGMLCGKTDDGFGTGSTVGTVD